MMAVLLTSYNNFQSPLDSSHQGSPVQMLPIPRRAEARVSYRHAEHPYPPAYVGSVHRQQHMGPHTIEEL